MLNSSRTLVLAPSPVIADQIYEAFVGSGDFWSKKDREGAPVMVARGVVTAEEMREHLLPTAPKPSPSTALEDVARGNSDLAVTTVDRMTRTEDQQNTLLRIDKNAFDLVIVDEAHHYPAPTWRVVCDHFAQRVVFLTATKTHNKGYILGAAIGKPDDENPPVFERDMEWAVQAGHIRQTQLCQFDEYGAVEANGALPGETQVQTLVRMVRGALEAHDMEHPTVVHKAMILSHRKTHADAVSDAFAALCGEGEEECVTYVSELSPAKRKELRAKFKKSSKTPRVLSVCG